MILFFTSAFAQDAFDLAAAMNVEPADLTGATLGGPDAGSDTLSGLGIALPTAPPTMAALSSGRVGAQQNDPGTDWGNNGTPSGDSTTLTINLHSPPTANSMSFDFFFLSAEYPVWVGSQYNDTFTATVGGSAWSGNSAIDAQGNEISVNSVLFALTNPSDLQGTGFAGHGGTGWLTNKVPVDPDSAVSISFNIKDLGDGILDSTVLLDNFAWSEDDIDEPYIVDPIRVKFLTPKRGSVSGYETTTIRGKNFVEPCTAWLDNIQVPTKFIDEKNLEITTPPHKAGLVDVRVECFGALRDTLHGGFTFYDTDNGDPGPAISWVTPYAVPVEGGEEITVVGEDFTEHTRVAVDEHPVKTTFIDQYTLTFIAPEHEEGLAAISVLEFDLLDRRDGALLYVDEPEEGEVRELDTRTGVPDEGSNCSTVPASAWLALPVLALLRGRP